MVPKRHQQMRFDHGWEIFHIFEYLESMFQVLHDYVHTLINFYFVPVTDFAYFLQILSDMRRGKDRLSAQQLVLLSWKMFKKTK